jgi:hypothetical protein
MTSKQACVNCGASLSSGAQFCHACGASQKVAGGQAIPLPLLFGGFFVVLVAVAALSYNLGRSADQAPAGTAPVGMGGSQLGAPDISTMSPPEQATRLYDMVMSAHEQGDQARMAQFAPMALQAYAALGPLDEDQHFHVGLISVFNQAVDEGLARADSIVAASPNHLFADILRFNAAMLQGDPQGAQAAQRHFLEHYDTEMAVGRQEYELHGRQLEAFRTRAVDEAGGGL